MFSGLYWCRSKAAAGPCGGYRSRACEVSAECDRARIGPSLVIDAISLVPKVRGAAGPAFDAISTDALDARNPPIARCRRDVALASQCSHRMSVVHAPMQAPIDVKQKRAHRRGEDDDQKGDRRDELDVVQADAGH